MTKLTIGEKVFMLRFNYPVTYVQMDNGYSELRDVSIARISDNGVDVAGEGYAVCHPNDQFNRNIGRKLAFARLLEQFPREQRKAAWDQFFQQFPR